jgi:hypothetical protein
MATHPDRLAASRDLARVGRRLRTVLDAGRRRHVADLRFYQLLTEGDRDRPDRKHTVPRR